MAHYLLDLKMGWFFIVACDLEPESLQLTSSIRSALPARLPLGNIQAPPPAKIQLQTKDCIIWECPKSLKWVAHHDNSCLVYHIISPAPHEGCRANIVKNLKHFVQWSQWETTNYQFNYNFITYHSVWFLQSLCSFREYKKLCSN